MNTGIETGIEIGMGIRAYRDRDRVPVRRPRCLIGQKYIDITPTISYIAKGIRVNVSKGFRVRDDSDSDAWQ